MLAHLPVTAGATLRVSIGQHSLAADGPNQDFHGAVVPVDALLGTKGVVVALADGIGSSSVSQVASSAAVRGFLEDYFLTSEAWTVRHAAQRVLAAMNSWLYAQTRRSDLRFDPDRGYVCTFSALIVKGVEVHLLHVGDSRIYRLHPNALEQLTEDHELRLSSEETLLSRALGAASSVEIDYCAIRAEIGDTWLLATDGAYRWLDAAAVHAAMAAHPGDLDAAARRLTEYAHRKGSHDDATVQLVRIEALPPAEAALLAGQRSHLKLPSALSPRARFEGCTLERELYVSARSRVWLAVDDASGRTVILKIPAVDLQEDDQALDRFMLEEWVARRISHPNVLRPALTDRRREHLFVAMEYVEGHTLEQWMTDHPRPDLEAVRTLVEQIARGLHAFHRREMLHQDLRPANVMIDAHGTVKLIDFASAHVAGLTEGTTQARADAILGTLQYTAPEYLTGEGGSAASDLFALAVLTYQMLVGGLPYGLQATRVRGPADVKRLHYQSLRATRPELPDWVDAVLRRALHPDPARRQESVIAFAHDLRKPGSEFLGNQRVPLIERHPVRFWQVTTLLLAVLVVVLASRL